LQCGGTERKNLTQCRVLFDGLIETFEKAFQYSAERKYSNMMIFSYKANQINNPFTLLLDTGGTDHDFSNPAFKTNLRENPNANVPIKTMMGNYYCKEICTIPFLGRAGSNKTGELNIISLGKLKNTPNVDIECHPEMDFIKAKFILLNITITFNFSNNDVLLGDGTGAF
jgi:hypothetical protein